MRFLFAIGLICAAPGPAAETHLNLQASKNCPRASSYLAGQGSALRSEPATPRKLSELPPADMFAAVYRTDERGCMVPVKYRDTRR